MIIVLPDLIFLLRSVSNKVKPLTNVKKILFLMQQLWFRHTCT